MVEQNKIYSEGIEKQIMQLPTLCIVIPCYNEQDVLPITAPAFRKKIEDLIQNELIAENSYILFVDDGSKDKTWSIIQQLARENFHYTGIRQSRNRGHQNAVLAGLMEARNSCDIAISIDCDGQDDINAMDAMIREYHNGAEIVYGVRSARNTDTFFKRSTAEAFYKLLSWMGVETVYNHADYRLTSKKVLDAFSDFQEVNLYLRGMFPLVGFKSTCVCYERHERLAGNSHYPLKKMLALAIDGITSLSIRPIRIISGMGFVISIVSFILMVWSIVSRLLGSTITGWASTLSVICFLGGIQLLSLGIIGEYIGKIYLEVKARPRYIISERTERENCNEK